MNNYFDEITNTQAEESSKARKTGSPLFAPAPQVN